MNPAPKDPSWCSCRPLGSVGSIVACNSDGGGGMEGKLDATRFQPCEVAPCVGSCLCAQPRDLKNEQLELTKSPSFLMLCKNCPGGCAEQSLRAAHAASPPLCFASASLPNSVASQCKVMLHLQVLGRGVVGSLWYPRICFPQSPHDFRTVVALRGRLKILQPKGYHP